MPSNALSLFDLAQVSPLIVPTSPWKEAWIAAYSVGEWAQLASKVYSGMPLHLGVWVTGGGEGLG